MRYSGMGQFHVYCISDEQMQPMYVGCSATPDRRYRQHRISPLNRPLRDWLALNSYSHQLEILDSFDTVALAMDAEMEYINYLFPAFNRRWRRVFSV